MIIVPDDPGPAGPGDVMGPIWPILLVRKNDAIF